MSVMEQIGFTFDPVKPARSAPRSRNSDPETAVEAGNNVSANQRSRVYVCLRAAGRDGMTDDDIAAELGIEPTSAGKRRKELQELGMVEDTGTRGTTRRGATAKKWRVTGRVILMTPKEEN